MNNAVSPTELEVEVGERRHSRVNRKSDYFLALWGSLSFPVTMHCSLNVIFIIIFIIMNFTAVNGARAHKVYELVGKTAHLSLGKQLNQNQIKWKKNDEVIGILDTYKQLPLLKSDSLINKFNISATNASLIIYNVTKKDSGHYKAIIGVWEDEITEYHLIVEEAVSEPIIDTDLIQLNSSYDDCRILVKCSADGDSMIYDCDSQICTRTNSSLTKVNITVAVTGDGILECTASNHVSTEKNSIPLSNTCSEKYSPVEDKSNLSMVLAIVVACGLGGILLFCSLIIGFCYSRKKLQNEGTFQAEDISTIYSVVCKPQSPTEGNSATTVYDVPSKCVKAPQSVNVEMSKETQAPPLEDKAVTVNAEKEEESENDRQLTVYWKLGQK
ncbi:hypothetical protein AOLI_G00106390 [Acnodon oligacanthus]